MKLLQQWAIAAIGAVALGALNPGAAPAADMPVDMGPPPQVEVVPQYRPAPRVYSYAPPPAVYVPAPPPVVYYADEPPPVYLRRYGYGYGYPRYYRHYGYYGHRHYGHGYGRHWHR